MSAPRIITWVVTLLSFTANAITYECTGNLKSKENDNDTFYFPTMDGICNITINTSDDQITIDASDSSILNLKCIGLYACQSATITEGPSPRKQENEPNPDTMYRTTITCSGNGACQNSTFNFGRKAKVAGQLICHDNACGLLEFGGLQTMDVQCSSGSCREARLSVDGNENTEILNITCNGNNTCANMVIDATKNGTIQMKCDAENSCDYLSVQSDSASSKRISMILSCIGDSYVFMMHS